MIDVTLSLIAGAWAHRDWVALFVIGVLVFLWRAARFDEDVAVRALNMRADDAEAMRRELFLRDAADGNLPSRWAR